MRLVYGLLICFAFVFPSSASALSGKPEVVLTLQDAINRALITNRDMEAADRSKRNARLSLIANDSDFDFKLFPGLNASTSGGVGGSGQNLGLGLDFRKKLEFGSTISVRPSVTRSDTNYQSAVDLSITQPLLRGIGRNVTLNGLRKADFNLQKTDLLAERTLSRVILQTVAAFYGVRLQAELLALNRDVVEKMRVHVSASRAKQEIGYATPMDTYRAEINLKSAEDQLARSREAWQNAMDNLKIVIGVSVTAHIGLAPVSVDVGGVVPPEREAIKIALANRLEYRQVKDDLTEARRMAQVAENGALPQLDLKLSYRAYGEEADNIDQSSRLGQDEWSAMLVSTTDIGLVRERAAYRQSLIGAEQAASNVTYVRDDIIKEVRTTLRALEKIREQIDLMQKQIHQAEGKLALAQAKFIYGMANNFNVIEAENELTRSLGALLSARYSYAIADYRLQDTLGILSKGR